MDIIIFILIGLIAGWLAGQIVKGKDFGLIGNLIIGGVFYHRFCWGGCSRVGD
jgi:uncharacterized membrane protein YeaQ/YmgE (transglycosylase-associated protein family)